VQFVSALNRVRVQPEITFITGTDTGVGKTIVTGLLLAHVRQSSSHAVALKPFCSGGRGDVRLLQSLQADELTLDEINPFYFREPLAPLIAARKHHRRIRLSDVLNHIKGILKKLENRDSKTPSLHYSARSYLLIEGSGGLLVPLGEGYTVADLIAKLNCKIVVVAKNRLGTINHTLLTVRALQAAGHEEIKVVLVDSVPPRIATPDSGHNANILSGLLTPVPLFTLPFLGRKAFTPRLLTNQAKKLKTTLARIINHVD
jgi:dethiobiotin synthetase